MPNVTKAELTATPANKKYTVLVLKPDYVSENFGQDISVEHVTANSVELAQVLAQEQAWGNEDISDQDDYYVLAVFEGYHQDIKIT